MSKWGTNPKAIVTRLGVCLAVLLGLLIIGDQVMGDVSKPQDADAATSRAGVVATEQAGGLKMSKQPHSDSKTLLVIPDGHSVQTLSEQDGWAYISYQAKEGYVPAKAIRYYSHFSMKEAQSITERVIEQQRQTWKTNLTKAQIHTIMAPNFTREYINKYMNQQFRAAGKSKTGTPLYHIKETEIYGYAIDAFEWTGKHGTEKPKVIYYEQDGKAYLQISQYHENEESGNHLSTLYLTKAAPDASWKVTDYMTVY
ncbi:hypothetical protein PU629_04240 [Pullulanibacillus sp. KACC 23026]|uniref:hypothetical protein n=1 Tax=Pullulanibacillus sp. KACC 23026 TaxID=3028315 RepID=UPI0023AEDA5D|nr:hypothetical protein [Pullulanibacillus sp. KACC 23026]WEG13585.1 hypothetical protein PU629_04240 [Pullulanibacillus sp. KACC 23026]